MANWTINMIASCGPGIRKSATQPAALPILPSAEAVRPENFRTDVASSATTVLAAVAGTVAGAFP
ncbi:hypothetical protein D3C77_776790 [compost metagenome]